ncbi:hypothetical protein, partial [Salmonella sp. NW1005]
SNKIYFFHLPTMTMTNGTKGSMSTNIGSWSPETISSYFASGSSYYDWSGWWSSNGSTVSGGSNASTSSSNSSYSVS